MAHKYFKMSRKELLEMSRKSRRYLKIVKTLKQIKFELNESRLSIKSRR